MHQHALVGAGVMKPGQVYVHVHSDEVIVVFLHVVDEDWCNYLVLSAPANDPIFGLPVAMENVHVQSWFRELPL